MLHIYGYPLHLISGYIGSIIVCSFQVPQILKILRNKSVIDVSAKSAFLYFTGCLFLLYYTITIQSYPNILVNVIGCICSALTLYLILKYKR